ncbi:ubiquitin hydrolase [Trypanosoma conorhini]|uniref:Ubiquitin hydrolase n=1 Tax=Trypanosoma conorhini TaxID=83891 RepID=A0A3R7LW12_9TRYP|nr:ubiquitin hydrolase [Trypanosoma conorhini]RNF04420.1 ubiquitin hydrolase [Trypanosoma conorhini]
MNYGRKVLEAEKKRTEATSSHALEGDNGYLKHNQAFPLAHGNYTASPWRGNSRAGVGGSDSSDGDYADAIERTNDGDNPSAVGTSNRQREQWHPPNSGGSSFAWRPPRTRRSPTSGSLLTSPVPKRVRLEPTAPATGGAGGSRSRPMDSPEARRGLAEGSEKQSPVASGGRRPQRRGTPRRAPVTRMGARPRAPHVWGGTVTRLPQLFQG